MEPTHQKCNCCDKVIEVGEPCPNCGHQCSFVWVVIENYRASAAPARITKGYEDVADAHDAAKALPDAIVVQVPLNY